jgi:LysM repeat protein
MIKLLFLIALSASAEIPQDSIGIETINGQTFVIHRVEEKETLFAISRRYRTTVDAIIQHNASAQSALEIGQILKVPYAAKPQVSRPQDGTVHKVEPKETLYSISRMYQVTTEDIKKWNNLTDNSLSVGQELIIRKPVSTTQRPQPILHEQPQPQQISKSGAHTVQQGQTLFSIARQYEVSVDQLRQWNRLEGNELKIGQTLYVAQPERNTASSTQTVRENTSPQPVQRQEPQVINTAPAAQAPAAKTNPPARTTSPTSSGQSAESIRISESLKSGDEIVEAGVAELIEGTDGNRKYLALHRTAPMGTILKVRNEMNNREVFVRVMGKLPDTAMTDKLIIKISKSAYDRLGAIDPRFRVEVTYYK